MGYEVTQGDVTAAARVASWYARRTRTRHLLDEWESAALVGLADAARSFDAGRGLTFWTFAGPRVRGAVVDAVRAWEPKGYGRSARARAARVGAEFALPRVLSLDRAGVGAVPSAEGQVGWEAEWHDELRAMARAMSPAVARPFLAYYGRASGGWAATAAGVGISPSRLSYALREAVGVLRARAGVAP